MAKEDFYYSATDAPNPIKNHTTFGDFELERFGVVVERIIEDMPEIREELEEKPGQNGSYIKSLTIGPRKIVLECRAFCKTWQDFEDLKSELAFYLISFKDDARLCLRTHPDKYYLAHYLSFAEGERIGGTGIAEFSLTFTATDPLKYGKSQTKITRLPKGGRMHIALDSLARQTDVVINCTGARPGSSAWPTDPNQALLELEILNAKKVDRGANVTYMSVPIPRSVQSKVTIDCVNHTVLVNGNSSMLTLSSDWPIVDNDFFDIRMRDGSGTVQAVCTPRYF